MKYIIHYANQENKSFWEIELQSLCHLLKIEFSSLKIDETVWNSPLVVVELPSDEIALSIIKRSVLAKSIYELWCEEANFGLLCERFSKIDIDKVREYFDNSQKSFRLVVHAINKKMSMSEQIEKINKFLQPYENMCGAVNLNNADHEFGLFDEFEYDESKGMSVKKYGDRSLFGRLISHSMRRDRNKFKISDRQFIGNTTMDVTLSFLMANLSLVKKYDLVYDPFVGSGSILLACGYFGAYGFGTDIDFNIIHGLGKSSRSNQKWRTEEENLYLNYQQYNMPELFVGTMVADSSQGDRLFRSDVLFDAIVTDPPYGIRESSRKVAKSSKAVDHQGDHIPAKENYDTHDTVIDLINFAASRLKVGGRLTFWLPVIKSDFSDENLPQHNCFRYVCKCAQSLGKRIERRLIVMEKVKDFIPGESGATCLSNHYEKSFRDRYFMLTS